ncbi:Uncharacterised protein [Chryseobacterium carnipullorum]|uniref:Uncharacterized protein n=1 Tax=Chryseobacterium carnipullorum TaxID=1124835 RepID=A0A376EF12_CHRCU|nr:Uncharacterised protein [Chryseobacterium carnipullorum]
MKLSTELGDEYPTYLKKFTGHYQTCINYIQVTSKPV